MFSKGSFAPFGRKYASALILAVFGLNGMDARASVIDVDSLFSTTAVSEPGYNIESTSPPPDYRSTAAIVTVGLAGTLAQIDVQVAGESSENVKMSIMPVSGLVPDGNLSQALATFQFAVPAYAQNGVATFPITSIDTASAALTFDVGDRFAIVLSPVGRQPATGWGFGPNGSESRIVVAQQDDPGMNFSLESDFPAPGLATYVDPVPLPAAAWLLLSGIGGLGIVLRRRIVGATALG